MSAIDRAFILAYESDAPRQRPARGGAPRQAVSPASAPAPASAAPSPKPGPAIAAETSAVAIAGSTRPHAQPGARSPNARRPLSSFAPPPSVETSFQPAVEVDQFHWSAACNELVQRYALHFGPAIDALVEADAAGRSLIGVGATARGIGCTTVVACLARLLVEAGKTVALVDGNFTTPGLAGHLGVSIERGWEEVLAGSLPLAEGVVRSRGDGLAALPLMQAGAAAAARLESIHSSVTAGVLRYHYDMVLFDLGAVTDRVQGPIAERLVRQCRLDGVILAAPVESSIAERPQQIVQAAPDVAALCLGVVENQLRAA